eukprot:CAMPEP_0184681648 /NCGR_PEP_ID=MMETSP0312-20130426/4632_1 /TAXON_ID=31354 /ORGANISM="Compsopogon coeruleus, Strain SAG 36.94" /LENGTH=91 /DNA_ID=CAMNT_0027132625 /DNA_START=269 /DNA_END=541 /DNA_ORIENTATION=+
MVRGALKVVPAPSPKVLNELDPEPLATRQARVLDKRAVEDVYKKVTPREHILLRPDTYIGSVQPTTDALWVPDDEGKMRFRDVTYVPGLYK